MTWLTPRIATSSRVPRLASDQQGPQGRRATPDHRDQPDPPALTAFPALTVRTARLVHQAQKAIPALLDRRACRVPMAYKVPLDRRGRKVSRALTVLLALTEPQARPELPGLTVRRVRRVILDRKALPVRPEPMAKASQRVSS